MRTKPPEPSACQLTSPNSLSSQASSASPSPPAEAVSYKPTERDLSAARDHLATRKGRPPHVRFKIKQKGSDVAIGNDYADATLGEIHLMAAVGLTDAVAFERMANDLTNLATTSGKVSEQHLNQLLAMVREIAPRDAVEGMLAAQMVAIHSATITAVRLLAASSNLPQRDSASNAVNKLARTFAAQVETLKRYRSDGQQTIKVQHVTVKDGGQAIVGNIHAGGGGEEEIKHQPHVPSAADERGPALLSHEQALRLPLPGASSEGLEGVPLSRSKGRSADRKG